MSYTSVTFYKFEATGNDFLLLDNREQWFNLSARQVERWCHRRYGAGADGLILLEDDGDVDFRMRYYNSDGKEASFCGNGGRAVAAFASLLEINKKEYLFKAFDGLHSAEAEPAGPRQWVVKLGMNDTKVTNPDLIDTGSPHHVMPVEDLSGTDIDRAGKDIRNHPRFAPGGCNVNFVKEHEGIFHVRTYERGVEEETLSCGTGVTATAIFSHLQKPDGHYSVNMVTLGGALTVQFEKKGTLFTSILLEGPVRSPFTGIYYL